MRLSFSRLFAVLAVFVVAATTAAAHHGWPRAEADQIELKGTIRSISFAPPHPSSHWATGRWIRTRNG